MKFIKCIEGALAIAAAMMIVSGLTAPLARAAYIVTLKQQGSDVVATGAGTIDLTDLGEPSIYTAALPEMSPTSARLLKDGLRRFVV